MVFIGMLVTRYCFPVQTSIKWEIRNMSNLNRLLRNGLLCAYSLFLITACGGESGPKDGAQISIKVVGNGTITPTELTKKGDIILDEDGKAIFDVRAKSLFMIQGVVGCGGVLSNGIFGSNPFDKIYTTSVLKKDCTITATFKRIVEPIKPIEIPVVSRPTSPNVNAIAGPGGTINLPRALLDPTLPLLDPSGAIRFSVHPNIGYVVNTVSGCGARKLGFGLESNSYITAIIVRDCTIRTSFTNLNFPSIDTGSANKLHPKISTDTQGNVIALWLHSNGTRNVIQAKHYIEGIGWGELETISNDSGGISSPQITMNDSGSAMAVWSQYDGTRYNIWMSHYIADTGWSAAKAIESNNYENELGWLFSSGSVGAFSPKVAMDNKGNAVVVWHQFGGNTENDIWSNRYDIIKGWSGAEIIGTENSGRIQEAQIVVNNDGSAMAVWKNFANNKHKIQANRYVDNIGWGEPEFIDTNIFIGTPGQTTFLWAATASPPQIATDGSGNVTAIWTQYNGEVDSMWFNRYSADSGWAEAKPFVNKTSALAPQLSMNINGDVAVVFKQHDGNQFNIWAKQYRRDSGWGEPRLIESESTGSSTSQKVAIELNGNAIAIWRKNNNIFANIYSTENDWGLAKLIETKGNKTYSPQVVTGMSNSTMILWTSRVGIYYQLWAMRYSENAGWSEAKHINIK